MGLLGSYVDGLPDTAKDRIIRAQDWCAVGVPDDRSRTQPLLGHAEGYGCAARWAERWTERCLLRLLRVQRCGLGSYARINARFARACKRIGLERTVRLLKLRAAKRYVLPAGVAGRDLV